MPAHTVWGKGVRVWAQGYEGRTARTNTVTHILRIIRVTRKHYENAVSGRKAQERKRQYVR